MRTKTSMKNEGLQLLDMSDAAMVANAAVSDGVSVKLTPDAARAGATVLEVRVAPFGEHKNPYPILSFGAKVLPQAVNLSGYSRVEAVLESAVPGVHRISFYIATLPYSDGGRNLDEALITLLPHATGTGGIALNQLLRNDASAIQYISFMFPAVETETIYRIRAVQAVVDSAQPAPATQLQHQVAALQTRFASLKRSGGSAALSKENTGEAVEIEKSAAALKVEAASVAEPESAGKLKGLRARLDSLSQRAGSFAFLGQRDFRVWNIDRYRNFTKDEAPRVEAGPLQALQVLMAQNEYRSAVFMVGAGEKAARLSIDVTIPKGLPPGVVTLQETGYLRNRGPEPTGDAVHPLTGPLVIPPGESRQIRILFNTQRFDIQPGIYPFTVKLKDVSGGEKRIEGSLRVWDFKLPSSDALPFNSYALFDSSDFREGRPLRNAVAEMKRYGMNIVYIHPSEMPRPAGLDADDRITGYDDSRFVSRVSQLRRAWNEAPGSGRLKFVFSISGFYELGLKDKGIEFLQPRWKPVYAQWQQHLKTTVQGLGIPDSDWMMTVGDEAEEEVAVHREIPMAETIKKIDPAITMICNTSHMINDPAASDRFFDAFDIFQPDMVYGIKANPHLLKWMQPNVAARGKQLWTYQCVGDMAMEGRNVYDYYRVYGWDALKYGLTGMGLWTYNSQAQDQAGISYTLVFSRDGEAVHARRFEVLREGMSDYLYVWLLRKMAKERGAEEVARSEKLIAEAIEDITAHRDDSSRCETWRLRVAVEIVALKQGARA